MDAPPKAVEMVARKFADYIKWALATESAFEKIDGDKWVVMSDDGSEKYVVAVSPTTKFCSCPEFKLASPGTC